MDFAGVLLFFSLYFYHMVRIVGENTTTNTSEETCSGTPAPDPYLLRSWNFKKIFNGKGQCMPIELSLEYGFNPDSKLLIEGATLEGNWFSIELKSVLSGDIPLHLHGRPYEEKFIKNSKTNSSSWGVEEPEEHWSFNCGRKFTLDIECLKESYKMSVNGIQMREFAHRLPPSIIDALRMNGAIVISHVQYAVSSVSTLLHSGVACFAIHRLVCHLNLWKRIDKQGVHSEHLNNQFLTIGLNGISIDTSQFTPRHCYYMFDDFVSWAVGTLKSKMVLEWHALRGGSLTMATRS